MEIKSDKNALAVVIVCYNRPYSTRRLLQSLELASFPKEMQIPLIISVDNSGDEEMYNVANSYIWKYGPKYTIIRETRMGLKNHIFSCADLSTLFRGVIILEDDLFVAPDFYNYSLAALAVYENEDQVAGIALNADEIYGYVGLPNYYWNDGTDAVMVQYTITWGQIFTERMWNKFRKWEQLNRNIDPESFHMPKPIKQYKRAWSKYYNMFLVDNDLFFVHPHLSTTTNFGEAGEHGNGNNMVHARMLLGHKDYKFSPFEESIKYDIYGNRLGLGQYLGVPDEDLCIDFYGEKNNEQQRRYWLTPFRQSLKELRRFALVLEPMEANIIYNIPGKDLFLYDTTITEKAKRTSRFTQHQLSYHFRNIHWKLIRRYYHLLLCDMFKIKVLGIIKKCFKSK